MASVKRKVYLDIVLVQQGTEGGMTERRKHANPGGFPPFSSLNTIIFPPYYPRA